MSARYGPATCSIFARGKSLATSSRRIPQGRKAARVCGCSGATRIACPFFHALTSPVRPAFIPNPDSMNPSESAPSQTPGGQPRRNRVACDAHGARDGHSPPWPCTAKPTRNAPVRPRGRRSGLCRAGARPTRATWSSNASWKPPVANTGADAIHPGYGSSAKTPPSRRLWSGRHPFCRTLAPTPSGSWARNSPPKMRSPCATSPWFPAPKAPCPTPAEAKREAERIGFPLLIKASAGGGGKGMRAVHDPSMLESELQRAISRRSGRLATAPCSSNA